MTVERIINNYHLNKASVIKSEQKIQELLGKINGKRSPLSGETLDELINLGRNYRIAVGNLVAQISFEIPLLTNPYDVHRVTPLIQGDIRKSVNKLKKFTSIIKDYAEDVNAINRDYFNDAAEQEDIDWLQSKKDENNLIVDNEMEAIYDTIDTLTNNYYYLMPQPPMAEKAMKLNARFPFHIPRGTFFSDFEEAFEETAGNKYLTKLGL